MIKTFTEAVKFLESLIPKPGTPYPSMRLERIKNLTGLLGQPETRYPITHVGGTSGKGSTATFAATMLKELGLNVGLHVSPHLERVNERIQINNQKISDGDFVLLVNKIVPYVNHVRLFGLGKPTYFETLVAMTFWWFARKKVDAAVIEVGLGGAYDATNIIPPSMAILTNVSLDHTHLLGYNVAKIIKEKMGIVKPGTPLVVSGVTQPLLRQMLQNRCGKLDVPLKLIGRDFHIRADRLSLPGDFQKTNFSLAAEAVTGFVKIYFPQKSSRVSAAISQAARTAFIPGRLEEISKNPLIVLDGAHNVAKMRAFVDSLKHLYPGKKWLTVFAAKQYKPAKGLLKILQPITASFILTRYGRSTDMGSWTAQNPKELQVLITKPGKCIETSEAAIVNALTQNKQTGLPILVTGSLYLVGEIRGKLIKLLEIQALCP